MECSSSPCISSFSSPSGPPDSLDQLLAAGRKRSKRTIVPSVAVAAASIVKRSKAVPGAGVQKEKSKEMVLVFFLGFFPLFPSRYGVVGLNPEL